MAISFSVGQRVTYRRLGEREYRTSDIIAILPGELLAQLATGEIARIENLLPAASLAPGVKATA